MPELTETGLARRVQQLRAELAQRDTAVLAQRCGAELVDGRLLLPVWDTAVTLSPPEFIACDVHTGTAVDPLTQALLAYYLHTSDGMAPAQSWVAFTELPDGRFYTQAFQGYTGRELAQAFGEDVPRFTVTAVTLGGQPESFANVAFSFQPLPLVRLLVVCWLGDEEFPTAYQILFDAHISHHLPTDACAILGSMLTRRLLTASVTEMKITPNGIRPLLQ